MRFLLVFRRENYVAFCAASKNALFEKKVTKLYFKIYLVFLFAHISVWTLLNAFSDHYQFIKLYQFRISCKNYGTFNKTLKRIIGIKTESCNKKLRFQMVNLLSVSFMHSRESIFHLKSELTKKTNTKKVSSISAIKKRYYFCFHI